jgi:hypothetical protein
MWNKMAYPADEHMFLVNWFCHTADVIQFYHKFDVNLILESCKLIMSILQYVKAWKYLVWLSDN